MVEGVNDGVTDGVSEGVVVGVIEGVTVGVSEGGDNAFTDPEPTTMQTSEMLAIMCGTWR